MAANNNTLGKAKTAKKDEFYTQLTDIENELRHYRKHFKDKVVFCNCDDPFESNFFKYFVLNFNRLGLKKLIATCYSGSPIAGEQLSLFDISGNEEDAGKPYKAVVNKVYDANGDGGITMIDIAELFKSGENELTELKGNGDFRSGECLELLDECDIVVTNPPFSLFREYMSVLMKHEKKFLIIGNQNALKYREIFPLLQENKVWLGYGFSGNVGFFSSPYEDTASSSQHKEGLIRVSGVVWFTNLDIKKRHETMILVQKYDPNKHPKFDNYDAIDVSKTADIPCDYDGVMGVPITFMEKYNPDQFELLGRTGNIEWATSPDCYFFTPPDEETQSVYKKQNKTWRVQNGYHVTEDGIAQTVYDRLFIKNKNPEPRG